MQLRINYIDSIKGIAIIFMVIGHSIQYGNGKFYLMNNAFFENPFFEFIYSFHMPLFMIISGYLFYISSEKHSPSIIVQKKLKRYILPFISYSIIALFISNYKYIIDGYFFIIAKNIIHEIIFGYHLWFLKSLIINILIIQITKYFITDNIIIYGLIAVSFLFIPDTSIMAIYKFLFPFFILGYYFRKYNCRFPLHIFLTFLFLIVYFYLIRFWNNSYYIYTTGYYILRPSISYYLSIDIIRFIIGLSGSIIVSTLIYYSDKYFYRITNQTLAFIGKRTLGIYCIQGFILHIYRNITQDIIIEYNYQNVILCFLITFCGSLSLTLAFERSKILSKYFLGQ